MTDVIITASSIDEPGGGVLIQHHAANQVVVDAKKQSSSSPEAGNECLDLYSANILRQRSYRWSELSELVTVAAADCGNVAHQKRQPTFDGNTQIMGRILNWY